MSTKSLKVIHSLCRSLAIRILSELTRSKCCLCRRGDVVATTFGGSISLPHRLCPACFNKLRQPILTGYLLVQEKPVPFFCAGAYEGVFQSLIHKIKYQGEAALCFDLAIVLHGLIAAFLNPENNYLLLPIPLHNRRQKERGYNQCEVLARALCRLNKEHRRFKGKAAAITFKPLLLRAKDTPPQHSLTRQERIANVESAFALKKGCASTIAGSRIILLDDVLTSGATAHEAAQLLLSAGAREVVVLTLARTIKKWQGLKARPAPFETSAPLGKGAHQP
ncbi:MAG: ComF family protein [Candidatus Melainabacteria bacterium]|nr:ComF family protein [Candidatus Melainabacteria bacterium]